MEHVIPRVHPVPRRKPIPTLTLKDLGRMASAYQDEFLFDLTDTSFEFTGRVVQLALPPEPPGGDDRPPQGAAPVVPFGDQAGEWLFKSSEPIEETLER